MPGVEEGTCVGVISGVVSVLPEDMESSGCGVGLGGARTGGGQGKLWAWGHGAVQGVLGWGGDGALGRAWGHSVEVDMGMGLLEWKEVPRAVRW